MDQIYSHSKFEISVEFAAARAAGAGDNTIDTTGYNDAQILVVFGGTVGTGTVVLKESDTAGGTYTTATDYDGNDIAISYTSADADTVKALPIVALNTERKRHFRLDTTGANTDLVAGIQLAGKNDSVL